MNRVKKAKHNKWRNGCANKYRYRTLGLAEMVRTKLHYGELLNIYKCEFCGWYHLGRSDEHHEQLDTE